MPHVVDTRQMLAENWLSPEQAAEIARRSRETMIALAVNTLLCSGIAAAVLGLIFWLADAVAVAAAGGVFLLAGAGVLAKGDPLYRMLGNAAAITGAGLLIGGAGIELVETYRDIAEPVMIFGGLAVAAMAFLVFRRGSDTTRFAAGTIMLMGAALHLCGAWIAAGSGDGWHLALFHGYAAVVIASLGALVNVRFVTALAIAPFAQMLDTGTAYFHAAYVFYSPEPTLTILQMAVMIALCLWAARHLDDRLARHTGILAIMAAVVGNLAFLVASLWGDTPGLSFHIEPGMDWEARQALEASLLHISKHVYSAVWLVLIAAAGFWAAHRNRRGLFNAAMTFGGIHVYTQTFETMGNEPLVWAIAGLSAIPAAWGMWWLNRYLTSRDPALS